MIETNKYEKHSNLSNDEDKELLNSFLAGDDDAFSSLYMKYVDVLFAYGIGLGFARDMLKDVIQDVFYKLYFDKSKLENVTSLKYYLFSMLRNRLLDLYRASVETTGIEVCNISFTIKSTILDDIINKEEQKSLQNRINGLLDKLTDRQREAVYLRFIQEMEYEEIGKLLDINPHAVRKLVSRAMKKMRE